jgi:hypothetical protein
MKNPFIARQNARLLNLLQTGIPVTSDLALTLGIRRLSARVFDLRSKGWGITTRMVTSPTGTRIGALTFTERQSDTPDVPVYVGSAPKHSRHRH